MVAGEPATMAAALEVPHGPIVEALLACGISVFSINPKQVDRFRDRYTVNGAKDDRRDAQVIAMSLATDPQAFKRLSFKSPFVLRIRELSRTLDYLDNERRRLSNQLRDLLIRYFPGILTLCPAVDEPWIWTLLEVAPLSDKAKRLTASRIETLLKVHRIRRIDPSDVRNVLQRENLQVAANSAAAIAEHVGILIPLLQAFDTQYRSVFKPLKSIVNDAASNPECPEHSTVALMRSVPGIGVVV